MVVARDLIEPLKIVGEDDLPFVNVRLTCLRYPGKQGNNGYCKCRIMTMGETRRQLIA